MTFTEVFALVKRLTKIALGWICVEIIKSNNVTIRDIASHLGVSTATVSMALSGKGNIGDETRRTVIETAREMGYETNRFGHALIMKDITIGIMIPKNPPEIQQNIKQGILDGCEEHKGLKFRCLFMEYEYDIADEERCLQTLYRSCDGIIIEFDSERETPHRQIIRKINQRRLPVVSIVVEPSQLKATRHVSMNAESVGHMAADILGLSLQKHNSRDVVLFGGMRGVDIHQRTVRGFMQACEKYRLNVCEVIYSESADEEIEPLVSYALKRYPNVAGMFVCYYLAFQVCHCLKRWNIDQDMVVVGMDVCDPNNACLRDGSLNVIINQQQRLQAKTAFYELIDMMLNTSSHPKTKKINIPGLIVTKGNLDNYSSII